MIYIGVEGDGLKVFIYFIFYKSCNFISCFVDSFLINYFFFKFGGIVVEAVWKFFREMSERREMVSRLFFL